MPPPPWVATLLLDGVALDARGVRVLDHDAAAVGRGVSSDQVVDDAHVAGHGVDSSARETSRVSADHVVRDRERRVGEVESRATTGDGEPVDPGGRADARCLDHRGNTVAEKGHRAGPGSLKHAVDHVQGEDLARARCSVETGSDVDGVTRRSGQRRSRDAPERRRRRVAGVGVGADRGVHVPVGGRLRRPDREPVRRGAAESGGVTAGTLVRAARNGQRLVHRRDFDGVCGF